MVLVLLSFSTVLGWSRVVLVLSSVYNFKLSLVEREGERDQIKLVMFVGVFFLFSLIFSPSHPPVLVFIGIILDALCK